MDAAGLIAQASCDGITFTLDGNDVIIEAPTWDILERWVPVLRAQKPGILQRLALCPTCGATDWRETEGGRWCEPCVISGRQLVVAVRVWSDMLNDAIWVVANDLPWDSWPIEEPVYTHAEVRWLQHQPPEVLRWVHVVKEELGSTVAEVKEARPRQQGVDSAP